MRRRSRAAVTALQACALLLVGGVAHAQELLGSKHALIVSIKNYASAQGFGPLPYASHDAALVARKLIAQGYHPENIAIASDQESPAEIHELAPEAWDTSYRTVMNIGELLSKMSEVTSAVLPGDTLLFYFSGHGAVIGTHRYFALSSSLVDEPLTMLSVADIENELSRAARAYKLLIMDTCANVESKKERPLSALNPELTMVNKIFSSELGQRSYWGCGLPDGLPGSLFTNFFARAITRTATLQGAEVTVSHLADYLRREVHSYTEQAAARAASEAWPAPRRACDVSIGVQRPRSVIVDSFVMAVK